MAVIELRSGINARQEVKDTLRILGLTRVNHCVVVDDDPSHLGMLQKVKDYVTWGEIKPEILEILIKKRGRLSGDRRITDEAVRSTTKFQTISELASAANRDAVKLKEVGIKKVFRLHPPSGGYKSTKRPIKDLGDLGYRGDRINDLITRMI